MYLKYLKIGIECGKKDVKFKTKMMIFCYLITMVVLENRSGAVRFVKGRIMTRNMLVELREWNLFMDCFIQKLYA